MLNDSDSFDGYCIKRFFDNRKGIIKKDNNVIIDECLDAYHKLINKNIDIFKVGNYSDQNLYILLNDLSDSNIEIFENIIAYDSRYYYDTQYNKYGIRSSDINFCVNNELSELVDIFETQNDNFCHSKNVFKIKKSIK